MSFVFRVQKDSSASSKLALDAEVSCTTGEGISELCSLIESTLVRGFGWSRKKLLMRQGSRSLRWLYTNAIVLRVYDCPEDSEKLFCEVLFNSTSWSLFKSEFAARTRKR